MEEAIINPHPVMDHFGWVNDKIKAQPSILGQHAHTLVKQDLLFDQPVLFSNSVNASTGETMPLEQTRSETIAPIVVATAHGHFTNLINKAATYVRDSSGTVTRASVAVPEEQRIAWVTCIANRIPNIAPEPRTTAPSVAMAMPVAICSVLTIPY